MNEIHNISLPSQTYFVYHEYYDPRLYFINPYNGGTMAGEVLASYTASHDLLNANPSTTEASVLYVSNKKIEHVRYNAGTISLIQSYDEEIGDHDYHKILTVVEFGYYIVVDNF